MKFNPEKMTERECIDHIMGMRDRWLTSKIIHDVLIFELFDILRIFEEWKTESGGFKNTFVTSYTCEDLVWMVFGVAAHASLHLLPDGSRMMHQGRSDTDVCEHFSQW